MDFEKKFRESKKAIAFLLCMVILSGLAVMALLTQTIGWPLSSFMVAIIITIGFLGTGYIFSTAQLDKYVRLAQIDKFLPSFKDGGNTEDDSIDEYFSAESGKE